MTQLGLDITLTNQGAKTIATLNPGNWTQEIRSCDAALTHWLDKDKIFTTIYYTAQGTYILLASSFLGRINDSLAATLFIPNQCSATGEDILTLIQKIKRGLKSTDNTNPEFWNNFNLGNFQPLSIPTATTPCYDGQPVFAYINDSNFSNLLGPDCRYQPEFVKYYMVFIGCTAADVDNKVIEIPAQSLQKCHLFSAIQLPAGVTATPDVTRGFRSFNLDPNIILKTPGAEPMKMRYSDIKSRQPLNFQKRISNEDFRILNEDGKVIKNPVIKVNGFLLPHLFTFLSLRQAQISVTAEGYRRTDASSDLTHLSSPLPITLRVAPTDFFPGRPEAKSQKINLNPIYALIIGAIAGVLITLAIQFFLGTFDEPEVYQEPQPTEIEAVTPDKPETRDSEATVDPQVQAACEYLDSHAAQWKFGEANNPYVDSLIMDLNHWNKERINELAPRFSQSVRFKELQDFINQNLTYKPNGLYDSNDKAPTIRLEDYKKKIKRTDTDQPKSQEPRQQPKTRTAKPQKPAIESPAKSHKSEPAIVGPQK